MAVGEKPPSADLSDAFTDALAEEGVPKLPGVIAQARKAGVDLSSYRVNGTLLLQYALDEATFELPAGLKPIELLLGAGCDPCALDSDDSESEGSSLHKAGAVLCSAGADGASFYCAALKLLLLHTDAALDGLRDGGGHTPLHATVKSSMSSAKADQTQEQLAEAVRALLGRGSDPAARAASGESALHVAAEWATPVALEPLLAAAPAAALRADDPNGVGSPLWHALAAGRAANATLVLRAAGGALGARDASLHRLIAMVAPRKRVWTSAQADYAGCAEMLLRARADPDEARATDRATPIFAAAAVGTPPALFRALLRAGARVGATDASGRSALMAAAAAARPEMVSILLEEGADVGTIDAERRCALLHALAPPVDAADAKAAAADGAPPPPAVAGDAKSRVEAVRLLLLLGGATGGGEGEAAAAAPAADAEARRAAAAALCVLCDTSGECALSLAAAAAEADAALAPALDAIADALKPKGGIEKAGAAALIAAARRGRVGAVRRLLSLKAPTTPPTAKLLDDLGSTLPEATLAAAEAATAAGPPSALVAAAAGGHADALALVLEAADLGRSDGDGGVGAALQAAADAASAPCLEKLLGARGGGGGGAAEDGRTLLMRAAASEAAAEAVAAALALLLSKGGDASARDKDGLTALAHAARAGNEAAVTALLDAAPATLEQPTAEGATPLELAAAAGHAAAADALLRRGAKPKDALATALKAGKLAVAKVLADADGGASLAWSALQARAQTRSARAPLRASSVF